MSSDPCLDIDRLPPWCRSATAGRLWHPPQRRPREPAHTPSRAATPRTPTACRREVTLDRPAAKDLLVHSCRESAARGWSLSGDMGSAQTMPRHRPRRFVATERVPSNNIAHFSTDTFIMTRCRALRYYPSNSLPAPKSRGAGKVEPSRDLGLRSTRGVPVISADRAGRNERQRTAETVRRSYCSKLCV